MTRSAWTIATIVTAVLGAAPALAQAPGALQAPHLAYVYPAGGRQGSTIKVIVGGRFLDNASSVHLSGTGVRAEAGSLDRPLSQREITDLREKLQERQKQGGAMTPALRREIGDARMKIGDSVRRNANPNLSEMLAVEVTIAPDARPGLRELRLVTPLGISNPIVFAVGQLPEFAEKDEKNSRADAETPIAIPAIVNGRIIPGDVDRAQFPLRQAPQYMPGDVDRFRFAAKKGQDLVVAVSARELMPYLADAVPGWFQAAVALFDAAGHELAYDDDYRGQPDPALHCRIPADGDYIVEIKDALFRGREDFVYRIAIGELPFLTSLFPLGGRTDTKTVVQVSGWNLASRSVAMDAKGAEPGIYPLAAATGAINTLPFVVDSLPETVEREPNDAPKDAQRLSLPVIVNGRIQHPGDVDVFSFTGRTGDQVVAEVTARRAGSPLDSVLELTDAAGQRLAINDDFEDKGAGLVTHQADSYLVVTLPAAGTFFLRIADTQHKGGAEFAYRLRVSAPRPDFELRVSPSGINAAGGMPAPVSITALRRDGFSGDIAIGLRDAPPGFSLSGAVVPAGQSQVRMTIAPPPGPARPPSTLAFEGRAVIGGRTVTHRALPAEEMMQAFAYKHLVPADGPVVSVIGRGGVRVPLRLADSRPVRISPGAKTKVRVEVPPAFRAFQNIQFELSEPPDGVTLEDLSLDPPRAEFVLQADRAKVKPGLRGNLIVTVSGERAQAANQQNPAAARRRIPIATLPAIAFEVAGGRLEGLR
jgi:hypothetical protein